MIIRINCFLQLIILAALLPPLKAEVTYFDHIRPIIEEKCLGCHSEKGVSFTFEDPEYAYQMKEMIYSAVSTRRMPPWLAERGHQKYQDDYSLSTKELVLFEDWKNSQYLKGQPSRRHTKKSIISENFTPDISLNLLDGISFLPDQNKKDDYRCFIIDWPSQNDEYVTGFRALPGNLKVAHHLVTFIAEPEVSHLYKAYEKKEKGDGYKCFGGAMPDNLAKKEVRENFESTFPDAVKNMDKHNYWLAHWAPGMLGYSFPQNTGVKVRPGSLLIVQMHYYSAFAPGESDTNTKMQFQTQTHVEKPAMHYPLTNGRWLVANRNQSMVIPSGESRSYEVRNNLDNIAKYISSKMGAPLQDDTVLELHSANVHMHSYGASGKTSLINPFGEKTTLLNIPRWDLNWQRDFTFTHPKRISKNKLKKTDLVVECRFENFTQKDVLGGFGSDEEMCFNFSYIALDNTAKSKK